MAVMGIDAFIIPSTDPHMSEYLAEHWLFREWISGFTGSAGTVVVTADSAGLWTDSRYFIQAEQELKESEIVLFKIGYPNTPSHPKWIISELPAGSVVGIEGQNLSVEEAGKLAKIFKQNDIRLDTRVQIQNQVWEGRPPIPEDEVFQLDTKYSGVSLADKIAKVRREMKRFSTTHYVICGLDEIAWLLNLRGSDVEYNPVFYSYMVISQNSVNLFIDPHKITSDIGKHLALNDVKVFLYEIFFEYLQELPQLSTVYIDPARTNSAVVNAIPATAKISRGLSIITHLKSIKNSVEREGMRICHIKDGVAMVKFLRWLESTIGKVEITELSAATKLQSFRAEQENYLGDSFHTVSAYGKNAALPHYSASEESNATLQAKSFYLVDSGGQYLEGTTDITRTVSLGELSEEEIRDFTLVLKGHINLSQAKFPQGTRGVHLDILARNAMWQHGINYGHGTGHGVGHLLNVHEGPQSIRPQDNGIEMEEGMITSNEPGIYKSERHGIRTENLILTVKDCETEFGTFYAFETITMCPIDLKAIDTKMLNRDEKKWLNRYHSMLFEKLSKYLNDDEKKWLKNQTKAVE